MKRNWSLARDLVSLVLVAFGGLGLEMLTGMVIEPKLFHAQMSNWTVGQNILHWCIICFLWGLVALYVVKDLKNSLNINLFEQADKMALWQKLTMTAFVILSLIISWYDWKGSKVLKEFAYNGMPKFAFQYIYYCFEVILVLLMIVIGQLALECIFQNKKIPYGGIIVALTWGIAHFFTKDFSTGLICMFKGFSYGATYLIVNRDIKKTYLFLLIMFIL